MKTIKLTWLGQGTTETNEEVLFSFNSRGQLNMFANERVLSMYNQMRELGVNSYREGKYVLELVEGKHHE